MVAETVRLLEADALGLQEVTAAQRRDLEEDLPEFEFLGRGRDADGGGEQACLLLRRGRLEALETGHFWLSETPEVPGTRGWDAMLPRICTWARLRDLWLFNTHLDHVGPQAQLEAARLLLDRLPDGPAVLMGDFNASEASPPIRLLASRLADAWRTAHPHSPEDLTWQGFDRADPGSRIDYLWLTPHLRVESCHVLRHRPGGRCPSDHDPVVARVDLR